MASSRYDTSHSVATNNAIQVSNNSGDIRINVAAAQLQDEERNCLRLFRNSTYELYKERNPARIPGTCKWLLKHETFKAWQSNDSPGLLWISADPGCGKSVLAKSLIDTELRRTDQRLTGYFFFKDDSLEQRSLTNALCALLHQIFEQRNGLIVHALPYYRSNGDQLSQLFDSLWKILQAVGADEDRPEVVCILDALDECPEEERKRLVRSLTTYYQDLDPKQPHLKFLVTSRPYFEIESIFFSLMKHFPAIRLAGEDESEAISEEINLVIKYRVQEIGDRLCLDEEIIALLEKRLLEMKHRTYLWLHLTLDEFHEPALSMEEVLHLIDNLPETVDQAYESILQKINKTEIDKARKLFHMVLAAVRPLSLQEMSAALSLDQNMNAPIRLPSENGLRKRIRNLCGLFIVVLDSHLFLIHQTAKEFLVADNNITEQPHPSRSLWKNSFTWEESISVLACICLKSLAPGDGPNALETGDFGHVEGWSTELATRFLKNPFLTYATKYWHFHIDVVLKHEEQLIAKIINILQDPSTVEVLWYQMTGPDGEEYTYEAFVPVREGIILAIRWDLALVVREYIRSGRLKVDLQHGGIRYYGEDQTEVLAFCGWGLLAMAGMFDAIQVIDLLIDFNADVEARDDEGRTPVMYAALWDCVTALEKLHRYGAQLNDQDNDGRTVLAYAAGQNSDDALAYLLEAGAKFDVQGKDGKTDLAIAAEQVFSDVVPLLLEAGADVETRDILGRTPFLLATQRFNANAMSMLLEHGAEFGVIDNSGLTAVDLALVRGVQERSAAEMMLYCAALPGHSLSFAKDVATLLQTFIRHGLDINKGDAFGLSPVFWMLEIKGSLAADLDSLVQRFGADLTCKDRHGRPARATSCKVRCAGCGIAMPEDEDFYHCELCTTGGLDLCALCYDEEETRGEVVEGKTLGMKEMKLHEGDTAREQIEEGTPGGREGASGEGAGAEGTGGEEAGRGGGRDQAEGTYIATKEVSSGKTVAEGKQREEEEKKGNEREEETEAERKEGKQKEPGKSKEARSWRSCRSSNHPIQIRMCHDRELSHIQIGPDGSRHVEKFPAKDQIHTHWFTI